MDRASHAFEPTTDDLIAIYIFRSIHTKEDRFDPLVFFYSSKLIIVSVQNNVSIRFQELKDLSLCFQHAIPVPEVFQMTSSNIRDHTGIWSGDLCKSCHLAKITDPHLQNSNLILLAKTEDRKRQSQFIVKVPLRL